MAGSEYNKCYDCVKLENKISYYHGLVLDYKEFVRRGLQHLQNGIGSRRDVENSEQNVRKYQREKDEYNKKLDARRKS
ncbi:MAG: hypothetical protein HOE92_01815 [Euryarchaeota archaeon]|nr:hypothetical protein [Euryarchaeota archaeon]MBT3970935.1 hypothetical protein [Euryarchaeota archaeon]